jgi:hypothetical protein
MITILKKSSTILLILVVLSLLFNGCKKEEVEPTIEMKDFVVAGGQIWGQLNVTKADDVAEKGVVIGLTSSPTKDNNNNSASVITTADDIYVFNELQLSTTYFVRGYTQSKKGVIKYSNELSFTTKCIEIDSIVPSHVTSATTQIIIYGRNFSSTAIDNIITIEGDCVNGTTVTKGPSLATATTLTVDVTNVFIASTGDVFVSVDKTGDACTAGGSILSKIITISPTHHTYEYSGKIQCNP